MNADTTLALFLFQFTTSHALISTLAKFFAQQAIFILFALPLFFQNLRMIIHALLGALVGYFTKIIIVLIWQRPRPFITLKFLPLVAHIDSPSFPSMHATLSFTTAHAIYTFDKKLGILSYALAVLISLSRVLVGVHYPLDIIAGAIIGILASHAVYKLQIVHKIYKTVHSVITYERNH